MAETLPGETSNVPVASLSEPPGAYAALATRARGTPDSLLVALESIGFGASLGVLVWTPDFSPLALPFLALAMFGIWGVAEHWRVSRPVASGAPNAVIRGFQIFASVVGTLAAATALYALVGRAIGTIIS